MGCCISEVEDVVKVSGPKVMLFDVLAVVDALGALFTAAAVLGFYLLGMKTWIFQERVLKQEPQVSQAPQVMPQVAQLQLREAFPECWERDRVKTFLLLFSLLETGSRRDRTTQRGRFLHFLRVLVRIRTGKAQLSGHKLGAVLAIANRFVEGCRSPDEALVC